MIRRYVFAFVFLMSFFGPMSCANAVKITIDFEANGGTNVPSLKLDSRKDYEFPANPTKSGFVFAGWYLDDGVFSRILDPDELLYDMPDPPATVVAYARWEIKDALVDFYPGYSANFATTQSGRFVVWGHNQFGQCGDGTTTVVPYFHDVTDLLEFMVDETLKTIVTGYGHTVALTESGKVFTWGANHYGQLGDGTYDNRLTPTEITANFQLASGERIDSVIVGYTFNMAFTTANRIFFWGENRHRAITYYDEPNDESTWALADQVNLPKDISRFMKAGLHESETVLKVTGDTIKILITSAGRLFAWGLDENGFIKPANYEFDVVYSPVNQTPKFGLLSGETIIDAECNGRAIMALTSNGRLFAYGVNDSGELGTGAPDLYPTPIDITLSLGLGANETIVNFGFLNTSVVLTSTGRLLSWGYNEDGYVGDGTYKDRLAPVDITSKFALTQNETITKIVFNASMTCHVFTSAGRLFVFGGNAGSYGDGTLSSKPLPTLIYD